MCLVTLDIQVLFRCLRPLRNLQGMSGVLGTSPLLFGINYLGVLYCMEGRENYSKYWNLCYVFQMSWSFGSPVLFHHALFISQTFWLDRGDISLCCCKQRWSQTFWHVTCSFPMPHIPSLQSTSSVSLPGVRSVHLLLCTDYLMLAHLVWLQRVRLHAGHLRFLPMPLGLNESLRNHDLTFPSKSAVWSCEAHSTTS